MKTDEHLSNTFLLIRRHTSLSRKVHKPFSIWKIALAVAHSNRIHHIIDNDSSRYSCMWKRELLKRNQPIVMCNQSHDDIPPARIDSRRNLHRPCPGNNCCVSEKGICESPSP